MAGNRSRRAFLRVPALMAAALVTGVVATGAISGAEATAAGPDEWAVTGVRAGGTLNIRAEPSANAARIGRIPHNGRGLTNLGCIGEPSYVEWAKMNELQRAQAKVRRWCRIRYQGAEGWVLGIYLREDE